MLPFTEILVDPGSKFTVDEAVVACFVVVVVDCVEVRPSPNPIPNDKAKQITEN